MKSRIALALFAACAIAQPALAQDYPTKPITYVQETMGIEIVASTPEELTKLMQSEIPRWTALIKKSGAQPN